MATLAQLRNIKVGDKIKTNYYIHEDKIIRTVTQVIPDNTSQSGILISCDGGEICPHCGLRGTTISGIDIAWVTWFKSTI